MLNLNSNQIARIHPATFKNLASLQMLLLSNNTISATPSSYLFLEDFFRYNNTINLNLTEKLTNDRDIMFLFESEKVISFNKNGLLNSSKVSQVCYYSNPMYEFTNMQQLSFNLTGTCVNSSSFHENILESYGFQSNGSKLIGKYL